MRVEPCTKTRLCSAREEERETVGRAAAPKNHPRQSANRLRHGVSHPRRDQKYTYVYVYTTIKEKERKEGREKERPKARSSLWDDPKIRPTTILFSKTPPKERVSSPCETIPESETNHSGYKRHPEEQTRRVFCRERIR